MVALIAFALLLFAETDPLSGGAGWIGAGLLGAVLAWLLLKHLPDKDRQLEKLLSNKDQQLTDLLTKKDSQMQTLLSDKDKQLTEQLSLERTSCETRHQENLTEWRLEREAREKRHDETMLAIQRCHDDDKETRHGIAALTNSVDLFTAVIKQVVKIDITKMGVPQA